MDGRADGQTGGRARTGGAAMDGRADGRADQRADQRAGVTLHCACCLDDGWYVMIHMKPLFISRHGHAARLRVALLETCCICCRKLGWCANVLYESIRL